MADERASLGNVGEQPKGHSQIVNINNTIIIVDESRYVDNSMSKHINRVLTVGKQPKLLTLVPDSHLNFLS